MPTIVSMTILMALVCFFAKESDKRAVEIQTEHGPVFQEKLFVFLIVFSLSLYGAMRTTGNDTLAYINGFTGSRYNISISDFFLNGLWKTEKGPIYSLLLIVCKKIVNNYHVFFLIVGLITNGLIVRFFRKFSPNLVLPVFLYICMSGYGASLTGTRQELATAVVIWTIPLAMEKKWIKFAIILWLAFRIHFVAVLYLIVPFLLYKVWNGTSVVFVILTILAGVFFSRFGEILLDAGELLGGENYDNSILYGSSINFFRFLVYCVTPILCLIRKHALSEKNPVIKCLGNLSIVSAGFVFLGFFGKANTFGRFGILFEPAVYLTLPTLIYSIENKKNRNLLLFFMCVGFFVYFVYGHEKNGLWRDFYQLESIFDWFK